MGRVGRNREKNKRMPKGWAPSASGVIYFRPTNAGDREIVKRITGGPMSLRLGATHDEAAETFARLIVKARTRVDSAKPGTIAELVERGEREMLPTFASAKTREERARHLRDLERFFGDRRYARDVYAASRDPSLFRALDVQRHLDTCRETRPVAANREVKTWSILFTWARAKWGLVEYNPCHGVMMNAEHSRDAAPTDREIFGRAGPYRKLTTPGRFVVAMYRYYGRRKGETIALQLGSAQADGLHMRRSKGRGGVPGKPIVILWDARLRRMWARLMRWREEHARGGKVETMAALVNMRGRAYTEGTFNCDWRRAMKASPAARGTFTAHDIRASAAVAQASLADAQQLLAHDEQGTTSRVYRRGPIVIKVGERRGKSGG